MRLLLLTIATMLAGCTASMAQVSTLGTTSMGLATTPGAIVTSPLSGPSPFSATTLSGTPDTTLAPVPLASDPTTPGTVVSCSTPTGLITPGTPTATVISTIPSTSATEHHRNDAVGFHGTDDITLTNAMHRDISQRPGHPP